PGAFDHQDAMPKVPPPEEFSPEKMRVNPLIASAPPYVRRFFEGTSRRPVEMRPVEFERYLGRKVSDGRINMWMRTTVELPDDRAIPLCALAYASDMAPLDPVVPRHGQTFFQDNIMA